MPGNPGMAPKGAKLFDWCMHKFNDVIASQYLARPEFYRESTLLIEFSRGGAGGFGGSRLSGGFGGASAGGIG